MSEREAIIGSREGANESDVRSFVTELYAKYPDTILVSGGATGVDTIAEQTWLALGGAVESYRPSQRAGGSWGVEVWLLGVPEPSVYQLMDFPTFENFKSAALARDTLIADESDRVVAFMKAGGSRGASLTVEWGEESQGTPRYRYYNVPCV
jgi:hypothetical protein